MNVEGVNSTSVSPATDARPRVLVVEDDPIIRRLIRVRLSRAGLDVLTARDGEEAIALCNRGGGRVDLVITDGVMPGIDGFELARHFSRSEPAVRVVLISGYLPHFVSREDIPWNIEAFFRKPFAGDELVAKVFELTGAAARSGS